MLGVKGREGLMPITRRRQSIKEKAPAGRGFSDKTGKGNQPWRALKRFWVLLMM